MFPGEGHVGSVDVDVLINHIKLKDSGYLTMAKILLRNGYREHPEKYFSFVKQVKIDGITYDVDVDILAGMYGGTQKKKRSQHVQGVKALKATGGNFAFEDDNSFAQAGFSKKKFDSEGDLVDDEDDMPYEEDDEDFDDVADEFGEE